jgi:hypothetical protein
MSWPNIQTFGPKEYTCGYCGKQISSEKAYSSGVGNIYICYACAKPTYFDNEQKQTPGALFGDQVSDIPDSAVAALYDEARKSIGTGAYTSAVLTSRKLLMHIAVSKGAKEGKSFLEYVEYLAEKNYIPPDAKGWVDHIRAKGNEANHEIVIMNEEDAKDLVSFIEMLLKIIYEFPASIQRKMQKATN